MGFSAEKEKIFRVSELTALLKEHLETQFVFFYVSGEVSGVTFASSGHTYFTLKDNFSQLKVVFFKGQRQKSELQKIENGQEVVVYGQLSLYQPRGELQVIALNVRLQGRGDIYARLEELKKYYQQKGYFDAERKKKLPILPGQVGIVTSPSGAAIRDIVRIIHRRFPGLHLLLYPSKVQGEGAAEEIAAGIDFFNRNYRDQLDVIIVTRGGGSYEDLWAFNEAAVVEAIYRSEIPVISAVGHEIDFTLADFVADLRAPTPSAAAEIVIAKREEFFIQINLLEKKFNAGFDNALNRKKYRLLQLFSDSALSRFEQRVLEKMQHLDYLQVELKNSFQALNQKMIAGFQKLLQRLYQLEFPSQLKMAMINLKTLRQRLEVSFQLRLKNDLTQFQQLFEKLQMIAPQEVLNKGYSIITDNSGQQVIKKSSELNKDQLIKIIFSQGTARAVVQRSDENE